LVTFAKGKCLNPLNSSINVYNFEDNYFRWCQMWSHISLRNISQSIKWKIKFACGKQKNDSLQSCRKWKDATPAEDGFMIQKFYMSFQSSGLTPKTPILGHLASHSKYKSKFCLSSQEKVVANL
jgi:hypothetical protein